MKDSINRDRLGFYARLGAVVGATLFLAACEVSEASGPRPGPGGPGGYCPRIYDPVCAARGNLERTFPNSCEARSAGWRVQYDGECRSDWRDRDRWNRDGRDRDRGRWDRDRGRDRGRDGDRGRDPVRPAPQPIPQPQPQPGPRPPAPPPPPLPDGACAQIYAPVCGQVGSQTRRFANECEMVRAGGHRVADGQCMGGAN